MSGQSKRASDGCRSLLDSAQTASEIGLKSSSPSSDPPVYTVYRIPYRKWDMAVKSTTACTHFWSVRIERRQVQLCLLHLTPKQHCYISTPNIQFNIPHGRPSQHRSSTPVLSSALTPTWGAVQRCPALSDFASPNSLKTSLTFASSQLSGKFLRWASHKHHWHSAAVELLGNKKTTTTNAHMGPMSRSTSKNEWAEWWKKRSRVGTSFM